MKNKPYKLTEFDFWGQRRKKQTGFRTKEAEINKKNHIPYILTVFILLVFLSKYPDYGVYGTKSKTVISVQNLSLRYYGKELCDNLFMSFKKVL